MNPRRTLWMLLLSACAALGTPAQAEVVYTSANVVLPVVGSYQVDFNHDGIADFALQSNIGQIWCQRGDGEYWKLVVQPLQLGNAAVATGGYAAALLGGVAVGSNQGFAGGSQMLAYLGWGTCGTLTLGQWLNLPARFLGVQFTVVRNGVPEIHYGWVKVATVAFVDDHGILQATTMISGLAYETVAGRAIVTGQTAGTIAGAP